MPHQLKHLHDHPCFEEFVDAIRELRERLHQGEVSYSHIGYGGELHRLHRVGNGIELHIDIGLQDAIKEYKRYGLTRDVMKRLNQEKAYRLLSDVADYLYNNGSSDPHCDSALDDFWNGTDEYRKAMSVYVNRIYANLADEDKDALRDIGASHADFIRFRYGFTCRPECDEPFYAFCAVNFDDPLFRSNEEFLRQEGKLKRGMEVDIASIAGQIPENDEEFREMVNALMQKVFSNPECRKYRVNHHGFCGMNLSG